MSGERVQQVRAALQADPTQAQHWVDYIEALLLTGQHDEACKALRLGRSRGLRSDGIERLAIQLAPSLVPSGIGHSAAVDQPSEQQTAEIVKHITSGRHGEAELLARALTTRYPHTAFGWSALGASLAAQHRPAEAIAATRMATQLAPEEPGELYNLGRLLITNGEMDDAEAPLRAALRLQPNFADASYMLGVCLQSQGLLQDAQAALQEAVRLRPEFAEAHFNFAVLLHAQDQLHAAEASYRRVIALVPGFAQAHENLGVTLRSLGRLDEAVSAFERASSLDQNNMQARSYRDATLLERQRKRESALESTTPPAPSSSLHDADLPKALQLLKAGHHELAERLARSLCERHPTSVACLALLGDALLEQQRLAEALDPMRRASDLDPQRADLLVMVGRILNGLGRTNDALEVLLKASTLDSGNAQGREELGIALAASGKQDEARHQWMESLKLAPSRIGTAMRLGKSFVADNQLSLGAKWLQHAVVHDPGLAEAHRLLGQIAFGSRSLSDAERHLRRAIRLAPSDFDALRQLATVLATVGQIEEAEIHCRRALAINPTSAACLNDLSNILGGQERHKEALDASLAALRASPQFALAHHTAAFALQELGHLDEASRHYRLALSLNASLTSSLGNLLFVLNYHPDKPAEEIYTAYREYEQHFGAPLRACWQPHANAPVSSAGGAPRRLRIGYVSPDFVRHSVRHFLEPLLASHDRSRFEVFAYAELAREDAVTERYRGYCDHFILTRGMSDEELAARIRADAIDVLVDVAGHTAGNRLLVFARKPAPVSLSWMGYGYTTGLKAIDYLLTDEASAPVGSEHLFSEVPWRLPGSAYVYRPDTGMGEVSSLPALANGFVTFGTLTRAIRINHRTVRVWAQILKRVPGSQLVIDSGNFKHASMQEAMAQRFAEHGIEHDRLRIGCHSPPWDTLRAMDIGLDCFPHNSGTTLFETLYMGVPYVSLAGRPSVGRLGKSILTGLGNPQWAQAWCADSEQAYIDKAVALASDLAALQLIRQHLRPRMQRSALMDEIGFARRAEEAFVQMFAKWEERQMAEHPQASESPPVIQLVPEPISDYRPP